MNKLKILLTGGNGFIGKNILEILGDKYLFLFPNRDELDLLDQDAVKQYLIINRPDIVIHAATTGGNRKVKDQSGVLQKNLSMFYNLCACKDYFGRMIVFGSGAEYDKRRELHLVKEQDFDQRIPVDEYGLAKFTMAKLGENCDFITHLRFFGVFGKYEDYETRFISNAICKKIFHLPITVKKNVYFDYIYIKDLVNILDRFIVEVPKEKFFNIGTGKPVDLLTLADIINNINGEKGDIKIINEGLNNEYSCDADRMKYFVGDYEFYTFEEAIAEMTEYYISIKEKIDKNVFLNDV